MNPVAVRKMKRMKRISLILAGIIKEDLGKLVLLAQRSSFNGWAGARVRWSARGQTLCLAPGSIQGLAYPSGRWPKPTSVRGAMPFARHTLLTYPPESSHDDPISPLLRADELLGLTGLSPSRVSNEKSNERQPVSRSSSVEKTRYPLSRSPCGSPPTTSRVIVLLNVPRVPSDRSHLSPFSISASGSPTVASRVSPRNRDRSSWSLTSRSDQKSDW